MTASLHSGDWIGSYQVESRLRSGGMATLFLARRNGAAGFSRQAAIKVIHPHLSQDERFVRMFVDEARISSRISHPNVVHVEEFGEEGGLFFLVMEYVEGCSASQLLTMLNKSGTQLPIETAVYIAIKVAEGLHSAHETLGDDGDLLGVVHRDVSPSNVLLSREGHIKLIDFGIAKARGRMAGTEAGADLKGKIRYMSPEQACGKPVDRRSDVYALGVVLWELLCADRAFDADNEFALLEKVREPQLGGIRQQRSDVPEVLEQIIARVTAKDPTERPANAYELSRELAGAVPAALLVDPADFATLIDRVPSNPSRRAASSEEELSWVSAPVGSQSQAPDDFARRRFDSTTPQSDGSQSFSRPSGSQKSRLAAGSAQRFANGASDSRRQPPTALEAFDSNLFGEPTPLPAPSAFQSDSSNPAGVAPPTFGTNQTGRSEQIQRQLPTEPPRRHVHGDRRQRRTSSMSMPSSAINAGLQSWFERNRIIILGGALLCSGLILGLVFGSGLVGSSSSPSSSSSSSETSATIPSAAKPVAPESAPGATSVRPAIGSNAGDDPSSNAGNETADSASDGARQTVADETRMDSTDAHPQTALSGTDAVDDEPRKTSKQRNVQRTNKRMRTGGRFRAKGKDSQEDTVKSEALERAIGAKPTRTKVDGVLLAEELDDDIPTSKNKRKRDQANGTTAGGTPLATGFDD